MRCVAGTGVPPQPDRRPVVDLHEVEHPVKVEIGQRRPSSAVEADDAGHIRGLAERSVGLSEQQVARILLRIVGLVGHVAFRDEEIRGPVVVHIRELVVPCRRRSGIAAGERLGSVGSAPLPDVAVCRPRRARGEGLQSIVRLAREEDLRISVARQVVTRDAHALHLHGHPAVV